MEPQGPERYRPLSTLSSAAAYVDRGGAILWSNEAFDSLRAGLVNGSTNEHALPALFADEDRDRVREILARARSRVRQTLRGVAIADSPRMAADFVPIRRRSGASVTWLVTLRPVEVALESSSELSIKAALTGRIVDDLRAPIQELLGWSSLLRRTRDTPEHVDQALAIIERNAELLISLLENLLAESRRPEIGPPRRSERPDPSEGSRAARVI